MKKIFTILFAGILSLDVSAQTDQGSFFLSGSTALDFASESISDRSPSVLWPSGSEFNASEWEFEAVGGYFVVDGLAVGLMIGYESESTESITTSDVNDFTLGLSGERKTTSTDTESTFVFAPMARYYFGESGAWAQAAYGFGSVKYKSEYKEEVPSWYGTNYDSENDLSGSMSVFALQAGYAIYLSDNISLNPTLGYQWRNTNVKDGYTNQQDVYDSFGNYLYTIDVEEDLETSSSGMTFGLGITVHLER